MILWDPSKSSRLKTKANPWRVFPIIQTLCTVDTCPIDKVEIEQVRIQPTITDCTSIRVVFRLIHPFQTSYILPFCCIKKLPSRILFYRLHLLFHCNLPFNQTFCFFKIQRVRSIHLFFIFQQLQPIHATLMKMPHVFSTSILTCATKSLPCTVHTSRGNILLPVM